MRVQGKRAIVTGAASGIGRAIARRLAGEGARVAIADLDLDRAMEVGEEIAGDGGTGMAVAVDVSDPQRVASMLEGVGRSFGGVDVLVNNAVNRPADDLLAMSVEDWDRDVAVTLRGAYLCTRAVLPGMLTRGAGAIVNIASVNGLAYYGNEAYSAAKAGLISLTRSTAVRYGPHGVRANAIAPGTVRTPNWDARVAADRDVFDKVATWYPAGRVGEPEDIAHAALFLASDEASWVTGAVLPVDGGLTAGSYRMTVDLLPDSDRPG
jgi:meso-butanediol dehydrogenase/(S,S)-butanediol dehydrogenase/diacetyl reductase